MNKLSSVLLLLLASNYAQAALVNGSTLSFTPIATSDVSNTLPADGLGYGFLCQVLSHH